MAGNIAVQYQVTALDDTVERKYIEYVSKRDKDGKHTGFVARVAKHKGGLFYSFPNGNSIMLDANQDKGPAQQMLDDLSDLAEGDEVPIGKRIARNQIEMFGLTESPRLVNMQTGEECDEEGRPLYLKDITKGGFSPQDLPAEFAGKVKVGNGGIDDSIDALE